MPTDIAVIFVRKIRATRDSEATLMLALVCLALCLLTLVAALREPLLEQAIELSGLY